MDWGLVPLDAPKSRAPAAFASEIDELLEREERRPSGGASKRTPKRKKKSDRGAAFKPTPRDSKQEDSSVDALEALVSTPSEKRPVPVPVPVPKLEQQDEEEEEEEEEEEKEEDSLLGLFPKDSRKPRTTSPRRVRLVEADQETADLFKDVDLGEYSASASRPRRRRRQLLTLRPSPPKNVTFGEKGEASKSGAPPPSSLREERGTKKEDLVEKETADDAGEVMGTPLLRERPSLKQPVSSMSPQRLEPAAMAHAAPERYAVPMTARSMTAESVATNISIAPSSIATPEPSPQLRERAVDRVSQESKLREEASALRKELSESRRHQSEELLRRQKSHEEELRRLQDEHDSRLRGETHALRKEVSDMRRQHDEDLLQKQKLHEEELRRLRDVQDREMKAMKDQQEGAMTLTQLAEEVSSSTAKLKLLQAQIQANRSSSEGAIAGQLEARERVLAALEEKTSSFQRHAQDEASKLQGILSAMEASTSAIRAGAADDRAQLIRERERLAVFQDNLVAEGEAQRRDLAHQRHMLEEAWEQFRAERKEARNVNAAEKGELAKTRAQLNQMARDLNEEKRKHDADLESERSKLLEEKELLAEATSALKQEAALFERRVQVASDELERAARARSDLERQASKLEDTKTQLMRAAQEVAATSERVTAREAEVKAVEIETERLQHLLDERQRHLSQQKQIAQETFEQNPLDANARPQLGSTSDVGPRKEEYGASLPTSAVARLFHAASVKDERAAESKVLEYTVSSIAEGLRKQLTTGDASKKHTKASGRRRKRGRRRSYSRKSFVVGVSEQSGTLIEPREDWTAANAATAKFLRDQEDFLEVTRGEYFAFVSLADVSEAATPGIEDKVTNQTEMFDFKVQKAGTSIGELDAQVLTAKNLSTLPAPGSSNTGADSHGPTIATLDPSSLVSLDTFSDAPSDEGDD